ncbi:hypothetical protein WDJ51_13510 [Rathayibacter sp. YIM 133350]|uniref:hypothetical protein n=1 Tax=Rathayibacter sp. YIM 133350 TaxID=3131992 RepID=UPI00307E15AD
MFPERASAFTSALIANGPTADYPALMRPFARLVGSWDVRGSRLDAASGEWRDRHFTWVVAYILEGRAVQDLEVVEGPGGVAETVATAVRVYDPDAGLWRVSFFAPRTGEFCHLVATSHRNGIRQDGSQTDERPIRWNFSEITDDRYVWEGWVSDDGGQTFTLTERNVGTRLA